MLAKYLKNNEARFKFLSCSNIKLLNLSNAMENYMSFFCTICKVFNCLNHGLGKDMVSLSSINGDPSFTEMIQLFQSDKDPCNNECYKSRASSRKALAFNDLIMELIYKVGSMYSYNPCKTTKFLHNMSKMLFISCIDVYDVLSKIILSGKNKNLKPSIIKNHRKSNRKRLSYIPNEALKTLKRNENRILINRMA